MTPHHRMMQPFHRPAAASMQRNCALRRLLPALLVLSLHGIGAHAGLFDDEEARRQVADTKRRVEDVNRQLDARIAALEATVKSQGLLDLFTQVESLRADLATLRGQIEVLTNDMESTQKRQRDLYVDLDTRMRKMETAQQQAAAAAAASAAAATAAAVPPAPAPGAMPPIQPGVGAETPAAPAGANPPVAAGATAAPGAPPRPGAAPSDSAAEQRVYDAALDQFKSGNYSASLQSFLNFVRVYPRSPLAPSAQYWVGNAQYALKDYRGAIASQRQLIAVYPDSQKVSDAMLNISSSLIELGDTAGAKRVLDDLVLRYPSSEAADRAKKRLSGGR